ncbi:MAG: hypothetical protein GTN70_06625 [Deltaproteobacteria bacterium]|nr:hypothetical protein [Deltaproteobacteria bacterium]NIS77360.1 hypothetical protein [Deltaproteobacteria bacterium]
MPDRSLRHCVAAASALFFIAAVIGYLAPMGQKELIGQELSAFFGPIRELAPPAILTLIFLNNALKSLITILLGFFFGLIPILFISGNGYLLGVLVSLAGTRLGFGEVALRILPHALFEVPAFILAGSLGLWLGLRFFRKVRYREEFRPYLSLSLKKFFRIVVPLLLIAALIETFVTPLLAGIRR